MAVPCFQDGPASGLILAGAVFAVEFVPVTDPDHRNELLFNGDLRAVQNANPASVGDLQDDESSVWFAG